jgi:hypothetical protein
MNVRLDMDKIARGLGAERRGKVAASGGYFGALQLLADIEARFRVPSGGGRSTDTSWTERRLVPLAPRTLKRLEEIAAKLRAQGGVSVEPMQLAALLLEKKTEELSEGEAERLVHPKRHANRRHRTRYATRCEIALGACSIIRRVSSLGDRWFESTHPDHLMPLSSVGRAPSSEGGCPRFDTASGYQSTRCPSG